MAKIDRMFLNTKLCKLPLIVLLSLGILTPISASSLSTTEEPLPQLSSQEIELEKEPAIPGTIKGSGTFFEIKDSDYLNITLRSSEEIKVLLSSIPKTISLDIGSANNQASPTTEVNLGGLEPNKTYYKYEDSYRNGAVFVSSENGEYSFSQDLTEPHHVWIQEIKGTTFISEDTVLNQDIEGTIEITADNITLDCNGHKVVGSYSGAGVFLNTKNNVVVKNCNISKFSGGISLYYSSYNTLENNIIDLDNHGGGASGIYLQGSNNNTVSGNTSSNSFMGIYPNSSANNIFSNNTTTNNNLGFYLMGAENNTFRNNSMTDNRCNLYLPPRPDTINNDIDTSNTVDGKPVYYLRGAENTVYDSTTNAGVFYCINCNNIAVKDLTLTKNGWGLVFWNTHYSRVESVKASDNGEAGIYLRASSNNQLVGNTADSNNYPVGGTGGYGIILKYEPKIDGISSRNTLRGNTTNLNKLDGINLSNGSGKTANNTLVNNVTSSNGERGISLFEDGDTLSSNTVDSNGYYGIEIYDADGNSLNNNILTSNVEAGFRLSALSNGNIFNGNTVSNSKHGFYLISSSRNVITDNNISNNGDGIQFWNYSYGNQLYHNNFINNSTRPALYDSGSTFDDGYPSGGNYWSDYSGVDEKSGMNQDQPGSDRIGDGPYTFTGGQDRYPFVTENGWETPENQPPTCSIKLQKDGSEINEINVGEFFDIYVGDSSDDKKITGVRFASDDSQNGNPPPNEPGNWSPDVQEPDFAPQYYDWDVSSGDWAASTKIKTWAFATGGKKEVWAEVKDSEGLTGKCSANIYATRHQPPILLVHGFQLETMNFYPAEGWKEMINTLTGETVTKENRQQQNGDRFVKFESNEFVLYVSNYAHVHEGGFGGTISDIRNYAKALAFEIEMIKEKENVDKVDIIAHSMGGLVVRSYIEVNDLKTLDDGYDYEYYDYYGNHKELTYKNDVRKLIMLGTPNNGEPLRYLISLYKGSTCGISCWRDPTGISCVKCLAEIEGCYALCSEGGDGCLQCLEERAGSYLSIWQMMARGPFLVVLNTPNIINFEVGYSAIAGNYCDIAGAACLFELLFPVGDGLVSVESVVKLNEIPESRRYVYPVEHSELRTWIVSRLKVRSILTEEQEAAIDIFEFSHYCSPGEFRVYDSQGRVTGLIEGEAREEIPNSVYDEENNTVTILGSTGSYHYEVIGTDPGTYGLIITSVEDGEATTFTATDIPTSANTIHQYTIDWDALSQSEDGVNVKIDSGGDGEFEQSFTSDGELTQEEFVSSVHLAKWLKERAKENLENAKTGDKEIDQKIDAVLGYFEKSLKDNLWVDEAHLNPEKGREVFKNEAWAVRKMQNYLEQSKRFEKLPVPQFLIARYVLPESVKLVFQKAIEDLIKADQILAEVALEEAENTPVQGPRMQKIVERMIGQAEKMVNEAKNLSEEKPDLAIEKFGLAWQFAQKAIKLATEN